MLHYVYETTNMVNGKKYIGKHSSETYDNYLGSGVALGRAILKYGIESFKREILKEFDSSEEAFEYEALLVTQKIVDDGNYYNMCLGGNGGGKYSYTDADKLKMSQSAKNRIKRDGHHLKGTHRSIETKEKLSKFWKNKPGQELQCSMMKEAVSGSTWWNNGIINKRIRAGEQPPENFVKGRLKCQILK